MPHAEKRHHGALESPLPLERQLRLPLCERPLAPHDRPLRGSPSPLPRAARARWLVRVPHCPHERPGGVRPAGEVLKWVLILPSVVARRPRRPCGVQGATYELHLTPATAALFQRVYERWAPHQGKPERDPGAFQDEFWRFMLKEWPRSQAKAFADGWSSEELRATEESIRASHQGCPHRDRDINEEILMVRMMLTWERAESAGKTAS